MQILNKITRTRMIQPPQTTKRTTPRMAGMISQVLNKMLRNVKICQMTLLRVWQAMNLMMDLRLSTLKTKPLRRSTSKKVNNGTFLVRMSKQMAMRARKTQMLTIYQLSRTPSASLIKQRRN